MQNDITLIITRASTQDALVMDNTDIMLLDINDFSNASISVQTQARMVGNGATYTGSYVDKISRTITALILDKVDYYRDKISHFLSVDDEYNVEVRYKDKTLYSSGYLSKYSTEINVKKQMEIKLTLLFPNPLLKSYEHNIENNSLSSFTIDSPIDIGCRLVLSCNKRGGTDLTAIIINDTVIPFKSDTYIAQGDVILEFNDGIFDVDYLGPSTGYNLLRFIDFTGDVDGKPFNVDNRPLKHNDVNKVQIFGDTDFIDATLYYKDEYLTI